MTRLYVFSPTIAMADALEMFMKILPDLSKNQFIILTQSIYARIF